MYRYNCGRRISHELYLSLVERLDNWQPKNKEEERNKAICELAIIDNKTSGEIERMKNPQFVSYAHRNYGELLSDRSISGIILKFAPELNRKNKQQAKQSVKQWKVRKEAWNIKSELKKPKICGCCGTDKNLRLHHILPVAIGGTNDNYNLIYMCHECHISLHQLYHKANLL